MHELSVMAFLVEAVESRVETGRIHQVRLEVGERSGCAVEALRFCFELSTMGTRLEGAALVIESAPGQQVRVTELEVA
jgi:hydrogenase nickel incorporation protein HypA/HybF